MKLNPILFAAVMFVPFFAHADGVISRGLEFRYYKPDVKANGVTDFKGETEVFDTGERIGFLDAYADFASDYFDVCGLDRRAVERDEIARVISKFKSQPLSEVRRTIRLEDWKLLGFRDGQREDERESIDRWRAYDNACVVDEELRVAGGGIDYKFDEGMTWRFVFSFKASVAEKCEGVFKLSDGVGSVFAVGFSGERELFCEHGGGRVIVGGYEVGKFVEFKSEVDFEDGIFNLYVDGERVIYAAPFLSGKVSKVDTFSISSSGRVNVDDVFGLDFVRRADDIQVPFSPRVIIDEDFGIRSDVEGWQGVGYDDGRWGEMVLPGAHGGIRYAGEDLYLRKRLKVGDFAKAVLRFETIDPGGEVFVNGARVGVVENRRPVRFDVTKYLRRNGENLIAVKVNNFTLKNPMHHSCADKNIGWFAGRSLLELSSACSVERVLVHTEKLEGDIALQRHKVMLENIGARDFCGKVEIRYSRWDGEGVVECSKSFEVNAAAGGRVEKQFDLRVDDASLWSFDRPELYKVRVVLKDSAGRTVDDNVVTTGIRTVSQEGGVFRINGKAEMLNGVQNMGYRMPVEDLARYNRCAAFDVLVEEILMAVNCGCNMFRVHVHAAMDSADGIVDGRIAELCDQLGVMLVWTGGAWLREGAWEGIDLEGLPYYIRQLYNHPSIVVWELSNHPNQFKDKPVGNSIDFVEQTMRAAMSADRSRLISPTTFWQHTHFKNDDGSGLKDEAGNDVEVPAEYTHRLCTRGTQDAVTGYGAGWSKLRQWPVGWTKDCLDGGERAFFNWEHEESIGQPNWDLCKGKAWSGLQSYEWRYDDGSIGRKLTTAEWRASQGWQAFSAYESMKKQRMFGVAGFSWCCIRGGANSGTYKKPLIDCLGNAKLAWYVHKLLYQRVLAGSDNVDVVYGPGDLIRPVIMNLDGAKKVGLKIRVIGRDKKLIKELSFSDISLEAGRSVRKLSPVKIDFPGEGYYGIEYIVTGEK
jgi:hypothetical protein